MLKKNLGSFRDPAGQIYEVNGRIIRIIKKNGVDRYNFIKQNNLLNDCIEKGFIVSTKDVTEELKSLYPNQEYKYFLEHEAIDYISYPFEWGFYQLKDAALFHLNFQLFLLNRDAILIDSSAYNIQFKNNKPIFIDLLSIDKYREGDYWKGHSQFLQQFLNPLLLKSLKGIDFNNWYKGNLNGIDTIDLNNLLNLKDKLSFNILLSVSLLAKLDNTNKKDPNKALEKIKNKKLLSKGSYKSMLLQLKNWIETLKPKINKTTWDNYSSNNTYKKDELFKKQKIVNEFCKIHKPYLLADIGCNDGLYSIESLNAGARKVIGFDIDLNTINKAYLNSKEKKLPFTPFYLDAMNPTANTGWFENERKSFNSRLNFDCLIALAFEHHLSLANNVPLNQVIKWLLNIAPKGLIEFVDKEDNTVKKMLALKGDIFPDYNQNNFEVLLSEKSKIIKKTIITKTRVLYEFSKS